MVQGWWKVFHFTRAARLEIVPNETVHGDEGTRVLPRPIDTFPFSGYVSPYVHRTHAPATIIKNIEGEGSSLYVWLTALPRFRGRRDIESHHFSGKSRPPCGHGRS